MKVKEFVRAVVAIVVGLSFGCLVSQFFKNDPDTGEKSKRVTLAPAVDETEELSESSSPYFVEPSTLDDVRESLEMFVRGSDPENAQRVVVQRIFNLPEAKIPEVLALFEAHRPFDEEPVIRALFSRWAEFDPKAALKASGTLRILGGAARWQARRVWVRLQPEEALAHFEEMFAGQEDLGDLRELWRGLADTRPEKAFELAAKIEDPEIRRERENYIIMAMEYFDPQGAIDWVMQNREGEERSHQVGSILRTWARDAPDNAFEYLRSLPETFHREEVYDAVAAGIARTHQHRALEWLPDVPEDFRDDFLGGALGDMIHHHSDRVMALVAQLPEGKPREEVLTRLAGRLAELDVGKSSEWIAGLPPSRSRDKAVMAFVRQLGRTDPEAAAVWAADIDDPGLRRGSLLASLRTWLRKNAPEAKAWIEAQPVETLTDAEKRELDADSH